MLRQVYIGFDPREGAAFAVARGSLNRRSSDPIPVRSVRLDVLRQRDLYFRPTEIRDGRLWDVISEAPMATEFAISRFFTPLLMRESCSRSTTEPMWAVFMDADVMLREDIGKLFEQADPRYAVQVVKHNFAPPEGTKMDGQVQTRYARKNWSSVMLFNVNHPSNMALDVELMNKVPGRDLHGFCWLKDEEIGELDASWNWLVGHSSPDIRPNLVHFTDGLPYMAGYEGSAYADEWWDELTRWTR